jgi:hypothetical protein
VDNAALSTNNRLRMRNGWMAIAAATLLSMAGMVAARWAAGASMEALVTETVRMASRNARSDQQVAMIESMVRPMITYYPVTIVVNIVLGLIVLATAFFLVFKMIDAGFKWSQVFTALAYAWVALAGARLLMIVVLALGRPPEISELADGSYPNFSAAAVLSPDVGAALMAAGRTLDAMTLVFLVVFVAVLNEYGGSRASERAIMATVAVTFAVWFVVRVGWAALFA